MHLSPSMISRGGIYFNAIKNSRRRSNPTVQLIYNFVSFLSRLGSSSRLYRGLFAIYAMQAYIQPVPFKAALT